MIAAATKMDLKHPAESLRIALVGTQRDWSGGEAQAQLLATGLRDRGHIVQVFARQTSPFATRLARDGFAVCAFPGRGRTPWGAWRLRQDLRQFAPDIVHMNDSHALTAVGLALWRQAGVVRVISRRVDFPIRSAMRYRWWSDRVLCVSQAVARICSEAGIPQSQLAIVPDGCDPRRVSHGNRVRGRQAMQVDPHSPVLLTVARLSEHKGHRFLLDAMPLILAHHPQAVLVLAGDGEARHGLEQQVKQLRLERHVRFLGHRQDVADLLQAADIFVMPSRLEGLCSSVIDAMLAGLPTVATTAGGIPDLLGDRVDSPAVGMLVPPRDPTSIAGAVIMALNHPEYRASLAQAAQARALRWFTVDCMVEETLKVYRELLGDSPTSVAAEVPTIPLPRHVADPLPSPARRLHLQP